MTKQNSVKKERVIAYIDGFNLYFGLKSKGWRRYYWLNLQALMRNLIKPYQVPIPLISPPDSEGKRHAIPKEVATLFRIMSPLRSRSEATLVFG
ncbi:MAG: hypothetical protein KA113_14680, partial [Syntrophaceae bacterium]|nr:hypothetical protein [Syntrophaceae bacterium]